jgi:hypothetical protein
MDRTHILDLMGTLKLYGMRSAYDEVMATGIKRQHEPPRIVGDLLQSEIAEKQARSIRYQLTVAKLPLAKDIDEFDFAGTPINDALVRDLATGGFVADQRNVVLIGGTGTGEDPPRHRHRPGAHPGRHPRALLQRRRPGEPARDRGARRQAGSPGRLPRTARLRHPR